MFAEILSTNDAVLRIAYVLVGVFCVAVAFAALTRRR
jgi:hypothetical protein